MLRKVRTVTFSFVLLTLALVPCLVVAAALLWVGTNAMLHGRGITQEAAITIANIRGILSSLYGGTLQEPPPRDILDLVGKLSRPQSGGMSPNSS